MSTARPVLERGSRRAVRGLPSVDVVVIRLDVPDPILEGRERLLSTEERERASRFRFERDRRRFVSCRGAVRALLASRTGVDPPEIVFQYGPNGKPELAAGALAFNVSHCEEIALCAVGEARPIGVDVERVRRFPELEGIAGRFFSRAERAWIDRAPVPAVRAGRFFHLWTLKEAWLKASAEGLSGPLTEVEIATGADGAPVLRALEGEHDLDWRLVSFRPAPGWVGALATREAVRPVVRPWSD